jgi:hypothetical protein
MAKLLYYVQLNVDNLEEIITRGLKPFYAVLDWLASLRCIQRFVQSPNSILRWNIVHFEKLHSAEMHFAQNTIFFLAL